MPRSLFCLSPAACRWARRVTLFRFPQQWAAMLGAEPGVPGRAIGGHGMREWLIPWLLNCCQHSTRLLLQLVTALTWVLLELSFHAELSIVCPWFCRGRDQARHTIFTLCDREKSILQSDVVKSRTLHLPVPLNLTHKTKPDETSAMHTLLPTLWGTG